VIEGLRCGRALPGLAIGCLVLALALALPAAVRANDFDQFQNARVAYESQNYALSADLFQSVLTGVPANDRRPIIIESRKYLAATFLFLGRRPEAEQQFQLLLHAAPAGPGTLNVEIKPATSELLVDETELSRYLARVQA